MHYMRREVKGGRYVDDACILLWSNLKLAKRMEIIVDVYRAFAQTVSEQEAETMCMPMPPPRTPPFPNSGHVHSNRQSKVAFSLETRMVKAETIEALLYGCSTWTIRKNTTPNSAPYTAGPYLASSAHIAKVQTTG